MSILIKGIEMPVACFDCPCMQDLSNIDEEYYICAAIEHAPEITDKNNGRLPKCPIVEIPTPHGRLIDENELLRHKYGFSQTARVIIKTTDAVIEAEVSEG